MNVTEVGAAWFILKNVFLTIIIFFSENIKIIFCLHSSEEFPQTLQNRLFKKNNVSKVG